MSFDSHFCPSYAVWQRDVCVITVKVVPPRLLGCCCCCIWEESRGSQQYHATSCRIHQTICHSQCHAHFHGKRQLSCCQLQHFDFGSCSNFHFNYSICRHFASGPSRRGKAGGSGWTVWQMAGWRNGKCGLYALHNYSCVCIAPPNHQGRFPMLATSNDEPLSGSVMKRWSKAEAELLPTVIRSVKCDSRHYTLYTRLFDLQFHDEQPLPQLAAEHL